jgi:hypothetical protein
MNLEIHDELKSNGRFAFLEFHDNSNKNCFEIQIPFSQIIGETGNYLFFLFVPFYPIDTSMIKKFEKWVELFPNTNFYFKSCAEEHHLADIMGDKKYRKSPVYMFYKNGEKLFEQIGSYLTEEKIQELLV